MSHLSTLITRVKRCEFAGCAEQEDCGAGEFLEEALREQLVNLAEYLTYSHDYNPREVAEAVELLFRHEMQGLICNPEAITNHLGGNLGTARIPVTVKSRSTGQGRDG